jgi:hypothetical protein
VFEQWRASVFCVGIWHLEGHSSRWACVLAGCASLPRLGCRDRLIADGGVIETVSVRCGSNAPAAPPPNLLFRGHTYIVCARTRTIQVLWLGSSLHLLTP